MEELEDVSEWSDGSSSGMRGGRGSGLGIIGVELDAMVGREEDGLVDEDGDALRGSSGN